MRGEHLAVEQERDVSIEFFLELVKSLVRRIPWAVFFHHQEDFAGFFIDREEIDHGRIGEAGRAGSSLRRVGVHRRELPTFELPRPIERPSRGRSTWRQSLRKFPLMKSLLLLLGFLCCAGRTFAQFSPALLQNDAYWNDGKAEFSIYGAE